MKRARRMALARTWIGLCLAALLAFAPPLNLAAAEAAAPTSHHCRHQDQHSEKPDCPGGPHHLDLKCLQCLALGGMSLAGATAPMAVLPLDCSIDAGGRASFDRVKPIAVPAPICRGPPAFA
jgi:hypothetical protein